MMVETWANASGEVELAHSVSLGKVVTVMAFQCMTRLKRGHSWVIDVTRQQQGPLRM